MSFTAVLGGCFFMYKSGLVFVYSLMSLSISVFGRFLTFLLLFCLCRFNFFWKKDFFSERICQAGLFVVPPFGFIASLRPAPFRNGSAATTIPNASALGRARERTRQISEFCASKISQQTAGLQIPNAS